MLAEGADVEVIADGRKFEELFKRYMPAWFEWARLHREAKADTDAKFAGATAAWRGRSQRPGKAELRLIFTRPYFAMER